MSEKKTSKIDKVEALPAKSFFVSMLTRDIELQDAILDLLDNCVDGATRTMDGNGQSQYPLKGFWAKISFDESKFVIEDNCGGIPWDIAERYAFRMGKPDDAPTDEGTIGIVGIGMKRAIFKMGRNCFVHSKHENDSFLVSIDPAWFEDDGLWKFDAQREKPKNNKDCGTIIEIDHLTDPCKLAFKSGSSFRNTFPNTVGESYSYLIEKGFKVVVNGSEIKRKPVKICFEKNDDLTDRAAKSQPIRPFLYRAKIEGVDVFLAVGYRSRLRSLEEQDDEKESSFAAADAGWTVVCNDRVVLSNDRSIKTGWGFGGVPNFHNQFSCIAGVVEFHSADTAKLPVTTTKRGVDASKDVYTLVRQKMQEGLKLFTKNTNRWKGYESELKYRFDNAPYLDLRELKKLADKLTSHKLPGKGGQAQYKPVLPEKAKQTTKRRISFVRKIEEIRQVSILLFDEEREPSEVGEACFDRFVQRSRK